MTAFIRMYNNNTILYLTVDSGNRIHDAIVSLLQERKCLPLDDLFVTCNGRHIQFGDLLLDNHIYHVCPRLVGGKGGFGSMLRAIGAQIEKTTSREACRDLSGRRMRDVNNEKNLKDWISKQADREKEREEKRREVRERRLALPRHKFEDETYEQQKIEVAEKQDEALSTGFRKLHSKSKASATITSDGAADSGCCRKRKGETITTSSKVKKQTEWLGLDVDNLSDMDSEEDEGACAGDADMPLTTDVESKSVNILKNCSEHENVKDSPEHKSTEEEMEEKDGSSGSSYEDPKQTDQSRMIEEAGSSSGGSIDHCSKDKPVVIKKERHGNNDENSSVVKESDVSDKTEECPAVRKDQRKHNLLVALSTVAKPLEENKKEECPLNLDNYSSVEELEALGLDRLKSALVVRGLKCGGTLQQRADRLMAVKGLTKEQIDPSMFVKHNVKGGKRK